MRIECIGSTEYNEFMLGKYLLVDRIKIELLHL